MKAREYIKTDDKGNFVRAYPVQAGWEVEINCQGKSLKYGASNCNRTIWSSRKRAVEAVNGILYKGIAKTYEEEHRRQFGY